MINEVNSSERSDQVRVSQRFFLKTRIGKTSATCCSHEFASSVPREVRTISSRELAACAGQELQEVIKKLEEEVLERVWRCGDAISVPSLEI